MAFYMHYLRNTNPQELLADTSADNTIICLKLVNRRTHDVESKNEEDMRSTSRPVNNSQ